MRKRGAIQGFASDQVVVLLIFVGILLGLGSLYIKENRHVYDVDVLPRLGVERYRWSNDLRGMSGLGEDACECYSLLGEAVYRGLLKEAQELMEEGADPNGIEYPDVKFPPPLYWAVAGGHPGTVELLLENGADASNTRSGHSLIEWYRHSLYPHSKVYELHLLETGQWPPKKPSEGWKRARHPYVTFFFPSDMQGRWITQPQFGRSSAECQFTNDSLRLNIKYWLLPGKITSASGETISFQDVNGFRETENYTDDEKGRHSLVTLELFPPHKRDGDTTFVPARMRFTAECYTEEAVATAEKIFDGIRFPW